MSILPPVPPDETGAELLRQLRGLHPLPAPPDALWQRIDRSLARRRRVRRAGGALAIAATLALAAVLPGPWKIATPPAALEELDAVATANIAQDVLTQDLLAALRSELRHVDRQLEAAYLGGDEREQIARLWQLRQRLEQRIEDPGRAQSPLIHL